MWPKFRQTLHTPPHQNGPWILTIYAHSRLGIVARLPTPPVNIINQCLPSDRGAKDDPHKYVLRHHLPRVGIVPHPSAVALLLQAAAEVVPYEAATGVDADVSVPLQVPSGRVRAEVLHTGRGGEVAGTSCGLFDRTGGRRLGRSDDVQDGLVGAELAAPGVDCVIEDGEGCTYCVCC